MRNLHSGLHHQATIIATAPLIGLLGSCYFIVGSFRGSVGEKWTIIYATISCLSDSLYPTAYGIALAILTTWSRNYLTHRADTLLAETRLPE